MEKPRFRKTEAIVLRQLPIGEADRLVTLYTPYAGKVRAVAWQRHRIKLDRFYLLLRCAL